MSSERLLNTLLQQFQSVHDVAKTERIFGTTTHLLTELSNPRNLEVLTSQTLTAQAIWRQNRGLKTSLRIMSIYNTAATRVSESAKPDLKPLENRPASCLKPHQWTLAVIKGSDDRSKRWQHLLVLAGVLMGMESNDRRTLGRSMRSTLEHAVVTAANLALKTDIEDGQLVVSSIVMALNYVFPLLSEGHKARIDCNALLPRAISSIAGQDGFCDGSFLQDTGRDTNQTQTGALAWNSQAPSFQSLQEMDKSPLVANMGPLSRMSAFAAQHATDSRVILQAQDSLLSFSRRVLKSWTMNPFAHIDPAFETEKLSTETLQTTWRPLWQLLRKLLFGAVVVLQSIVGRSLLDPHLLRDQIAPRMATKSLHILRNFFFISNRENNNSFQVYTFTYLTSIDILSRSSAVSTEFLQGIRLKDDLVVSPGHLQRSLDLFYLNVCEHLPLNMSTDACDTLVIKPAVQYLSLDGPVTRSMTELFESAHSAILAVLSCPQHSQLTISMAPFYIVKLLESFPSQISSRQFRFAFKTIMQIVSPPYPIAALEPHLSETLLEMLYTQSERASSVALSQAPDATAESQESQSDELLSEQSALILALIDSIPFLPLPLIEEWLTLTAKCLSQIANPRLREPVKSRLWEILVSGEMDVERAAIGVAWWGTQGGRELVLSGSQQAPAMMSGAIINDGANSKL